MTPSRNMPKSKVETAIVVAESTTGEVGEGRGEGIDPKVGGGTEGDLGLG